MLKQIVEACRPFFADAKVQQKELGSLGIADFLEWKRARGLNVEAFCQETLHLAEALVSINVAAGGGMPAAKREVLVGSSDPQAQEHFGTLAQRRFSVDDPALLIVVTLLTGIPFVNVTMYPAGREAYERDPFVLLHAVDLEELQGASGEWKGQTGNGSNALSAHAYR
jgi:hypothetical protein